MNNKANGKLTNLSKILRRNMTAEEKHLWYDFLKQIPLTVNRQKVIGNYIADFYCAEASIVIEVDGYQHGTYIGRGDELKKEQYFNSLGIKVLRYSNKDVNSNFENVCEDIWLHITGEKPQ